MREILNVMICDNSLNFGIPLMDFLRKNEFNAFCRRGDINIICSDALLDSCHVIVVYSELLCDNIFAFVKHIRSQHPNIRVIIITSHSNKDFSLSLADYGVYITLTMPVSLYDIQKYIEKNVSPYNYTPRLQRNILSYLIKIGFPIHLNGAAYIACAVENTIRNPEFISSITTDMYSLISAQFNVSSKMVERSIRHAIDVASKRQILAKLKNNTNPDFADDFDSFTNSEFIVAIADMFCKEFNISNL